MGWGRMLFLGDLGQQLDIGDLEREVARLRESHEEAWRSASRVADLTSEVRRLSQELDEAKLYIATLIRLMVSKGVCTQEDISAVLRLVDKLDGVADGKLTSPTGQSLGRA